ncbi:MAG: TRAP transporter large permease [Deltaproteobacteria bacterium]|nr:TRAP transporter large permease [Deltaproteobacteria bacterium]
MAGLLGAILLFVLLALGMHIGIALAVSGFVGVAFLSGFEQAISMSVTAIYHKVSGPALITLPLFILMGYLASGGGISATLYDSLGMWLGKIRGGLGIATVFACTAFGTVCGSSIVTTAVFANLCAPEMRKHGYSKEMAYAICASAGSIGMLIPPSIIGIVYGMVSGLSIGKVLMAGVMPGLIWAILFSLTIPISAKIYPSWIQPDPHIAQATWQQRISSLKHWWPILLVAGAMFGGIYGGIFTPTEAASVAAFIMMIYFALIRVFRSKGEKRKQSLTELHQILKDTATTSALVFLILGSATIFSNFTVLTGMTDQINQLVKTYQLGPITLILLFNFIYLILGCFLDSISMICITVPVFNPIITAAGIDPIWYATLVIIAVHIGLVTPPVGMNLYAAKGVAEPDVSLEDIIRGIVPFLIAETISFFLVLGFPILATYLPSFVG